MIKRIIFLVLGFYLLTVFQSAFLVHFRVWGVVPNLVLLAVIFINLLASPYKKWGFFSGFLGGVYLDIFSFGSFYFFGFFTLISLTLSLLIQLVLRHYVRVSFIKRA